MPYVPGTQRLAKANDPGTWRTHAQAVADGRPAGVALTPAMNLTLIDVDGQSDHPLIATMNSYTERSISGNGLHVLVLGRPPAGFVAPAGVEIYPRDGNRFLILTGDVLEGRDTIQDRTNLLAALFPPAPPVTLPPSAPLTLEDADIIQRARAARNGHAVAALFDHGDTSAHGGDASRADQALCSLLSFWTQDVAQLDRIFRRSALMRSKWERADYRDGTIRKALQRSDFYEPGPAPAPMPASDPCSPVRDDLAEARAEVAALKAENAALKRQAATLQPAHDRLSQLQSATMRLLSSSTLRSGEKIIALVSLFEVEAAQSHGATDPDGWSDAPLARLGESAGCSPKVAGKHLTTVASTGILETRTIPRHDPRTREVTKHRQIRAPREMTGDPAPSLPERILALSAATPARDPGEKGWGGKRTCPACGDAGTVTRTVVYCKGCGQVLSQNQTKQERAPAPKDQDGPSGSVLEPESLIGHLALSKNDCGGESLIGHLDPSGVRAQSRARAAADPAAREPAWINDVPPVLDPDPDAPYAPIPLFAPPRPRSVHFDVGG